MADSNANGIQRQKLALKILWAIGISSMRSLGAQKVFASLGMRSVVAGAPHWRQKGGMTTRKEMPEQLLSSMTAFLLGLTSCPYFIWLCERPNDKLEADGH